MDETGVALFMDSTELQSCIKNVSTKVRKNWKRLEETGNWKIHLGYFSAFICMCPVATKDLSRTFGYLFYKIEVSTSLLTEGMLISA